MADRLHASPPLAGLAFEAPGLAIRPVEGLAMAAIAVRRGADAGACLGLTLPTRPAAIFAGPRTFLWLGPALYLALAPTPQAFPSPPDSVRGASPPFPLAGDLARALSGLADVTDLAGARTVIALAGPGARAPLQALLPIDLHPRAFGPGSAAATLAAQIGVLVWQVDEAPTYHVACQRSFARSLWHALTAEAAAAPSGRAAPA